MVFPYGRDIGTLNADYADMFKLNSLFLLNIANFTQQSVKNDFHEKENLNSVQNRENY